MNNWTKSSIDSACHILDNLRIPVSEIERNKRKGNVPYYGANGIQGYIDGYIFNEKLVLLAEDGGNFEDYSMRPIAYRIDGYSWVNNHAHVLKAKSDFDIDYIFYSLQHKNILKHITGGTRGKLNQSELKSIIFECPSDFKEQKTIAIILDTIDEAIAAAEAQLAKQEKIKQGLLQDLLTRGIDETGQIRPHWEDSPDFYKKSELGFVPKEWIVRELKDVATLQRGLDLPNQDRNIGDFPIYGSNGIDGWHNKPAIHDSGVITGRSGSIGFVYFSPVPFWPLNTTLYVKNFHENNKKFIKLLLQFLDLKKYAASTGVPSLNRNFVHPELVRVPKLDEQNLIVQMEEVSDDKLKEMRSEIKKLKKIKTGLMQDLLTGQRRVTPELIRQVETLTGSI
jgi:type I restriction enzyme S subunit